MSEIYRVTFDDNARRERTFRCEEAPDREFVAHPPAAWEYTSERLALCRVTQLLVKHPLADLSEKRDVRGGVTEFRLVFP